MYLGIRGSVISDDEWFVGFLASMFEQMPVTNVAVETLGNLGYSLLRVGTTPSNEDDTLPTPDDRDYEQESYNHYGDQFNDMDFYDQANEFATLKALNNLEIMLDILDRISTETDPSELADVAYELRSLASQAVSYLETVLPEDDEDGGDEFRDGYSIRDDLDDDEDDEEGRYE